MRKSTWKEKPIFLRIVYLIAIIFECYIVISFTVDLVKSIILKQIVNIVSEVEALTLPGFLTNLTLSIYGILFWGFILLTFCALITLIYRKIFKITCYKADRCKDKLLNKKVLPVMINGGILIIVTILRAGSLIALVSGSALADSTSGPLVFVIAFPLLMAGAIVIIVVEALIEILIPFLYRWVIRMLNFINSKRIEEQ